VEQGRDLSTALAGLGLALALYAFFVLTLVLAGRRSDARALAGFIPDCLVLVRALLRDPRVPRRRKPRSRGASGVPPRGFEPRFPP